ncbi:MAG: DEAD/DEAH box helicase [Porphyromonas sp.]|nr:DEAD/DEAH box helicase [Porphyromonas sp.]
MSFEDFDLAPAVMDGLDAMNFQKPSPVQAASIPHILEGEDVIACAQTGTGKTAAFLLPILSKLASGDYPEQYINAVIMSPTRELAQQTDQQIDAFSYFLGISAVPIYGGTGGIEWEQQKRALRLGADIIVATPGRLISHINLNTVNLSHVSFFVLDEADRMLDMGFNDDILEIRKKLPDNVQTIMFSATMPPNIRTLAKKIMRDPVEVNIAISRPPESINQSCYYVHEESKLSLLVQLLKENEQKKCVVFFAAKARVREAYRMLKMQGLSVEEMHSDRDQESREEVMRDFKNGNTRIILATDIISRGIDIVDIDLVINYDVPSDSEDYVHRIGRTARGDHEAGAAITFVNDKDKRSFDSIEKFLGYKVRRNELPEGLQTTRPKRAYKGGRRGTSKPRSQHQRGGDQRRDNQGKRRRNNRPRGRGKSPQKSN